MSTSDLSLSQDFDRVKDALGKISRRIGLVGQMMTDDVPSPQDAVLVALQEIRRDVTLSRIAVSRSLSVASKRAGGGTRVEDIFTAVSRQVGQAIDGMLSNREKTVQENFVFVQGLQQGVERILTNAQRTGGLKRLSDQEIALIQSQAGNYAVGPDEDGRHPSPYAQ